MNLRALFFGAAFAVMTASAHAATITETVDVTGSDFTGGGSVLPVDPAYVDFTVTFDPSATFGPTTSGLTIISTNVPESWEIAGEPGYLTLATYASPGGCYNPADSACIFLGTPLQSGGYVFFQQSTSDGAYWVAQDVTVSVSAGVPEPATWSMLILGLGAVGVALRRRPVTVAA